MNKAIFFDRDGIVNQRIMCGYVRSLDEFVFIDAFFQLFEFAVQHDYLKIIVSNQQGVAKGLMTMNDLEAINEYIQLQLHQRYDCAFDDVYYCTDLSSANSTRRKPAPGMLLDAGIKWNIDLGSSWMIGDSISDVHAGRAAGTRTILVGDFESVREADWIVPTVSAVLPVLLSEHQN